MPRALGGTFPMSICQLRNCDSRLPWAFEGPQMRPVLPARRSGFASLGLMPVVVSDRHAPQCPPLSRLRASRRSMYR
jgi:hypothetical protein